MGEAFTRHSLRPLVVERAERPENLDAMRRGIAPARALRSLSVLRDARRAGS
jgi:hypothetical protein